MIYRSMGVEFIIRQDGEGCRGWGAVRSRGSARKTLEMHRWVLTQCIFIYMGRDLYLYGYMICIYEMSYQKIEGGKKK